jgi:hypothetical protein
MDTKSCLFSFTSKVLMKFAIRRYRMPNAAQMQDSKVVRSFNERDSPRYVNIVIEKFEGEARN